MFDGKKAIEELQKAVSLVEAIPVTGNCQDIAVAAKGTIRDVVEQLAEEFGAGDKFVSYTD